ncbi:hypothetical protein KSX_89140 [Ktedonospora formicarum]|uniref:Anaphase-promoting complex subunit 4-like WD40 domain-containing protein n=2 Tax=Ktedonospora formicarum TaxID=2778364 RepID=A0A8J3I8T9_9CHLR|nr:hypothetical protein KSX_89140 [Ktedonospora formicarum]
MDRNSHNPAMSAGPVKEGKLPRRRVLLGLAGLTIAGMGGAWWFSTRSASPPPRPTLLHTYQWQTEAHDVLGIAWSPDGTRLTAAKMPSTAGDVATQTWNVADGHLIFTLKEPIMIYSLSWSPDGTRLAVACSDDEVKVCNGADGRLISTLRTSARQDSYHEVIWLADGKRLASVGRDQYDNMDRGPAVRVWDTATGRLLSTVVFGTTTWSPLVLSPDGKYLASFDETSSSRMFRYGIPPMVT